ncbi:hypothetical protein AB0M89_27895 [Streptomyces microflavus]|uniref:hypothetical protein n=1 Tax=Streptomyces microflavus TaxID=1919 RepID=UPI0034441039
MGVRAQLSPLQLRAEEHDDLMGLVGIEEGAQFGEERRVRLGRRSTVRRGAGTTGSGGRDGVARP